MSAPDFSVNGQHVLISGGAGGIKHFMEGVFTGLAPVFKTLGNPEITPELKQTVIEGVLQEAGNRSVEQLADEENELLVRLLRLRGAVSKVA